jgi:NAD(P)H-dependent FMN reductase
MRKVLVISSSLRKNSNSEKLALSFSEGAKNSGHDVEFISLRDKKIEFCRGCLACQKSLRCVIRDDADKITQKMLNADVLVFATPIYYYEMSGQLKTILDRANPLFSADYKFREVFLLATAAEEGAEVFSRALNGLEGWIECFEKVKLAGEIFVGGVTNAGEIKNHIDLEKSFELGKNLS